MDWQRWHIEHCQRGSVVAGHGYILRLTKRCWCLPGPPEPLFLHLALGGTGAGACGGPLNLSPCTRCAPTTPLDPWMPRCAAWLPAACPRSFSSSSATPSSCSRPSTTATTSCSRPPPVRHRPTAWHCQSIAAPPLLLGLRALLLLNGGDAVPCAHAKKWGTCHVLHSPSLQKRG